MLVVSLRQERNDKELSTRKSIMPECGGYRVSVQVNGVDLDEFGVEHDQEQVICWIPAEPGQEFEVHVHRLEHLDFDWVASLRSDGEHSTGMIMSHHRLSTKIDAQRGTDENGQACWRAFVFAPRPAAETTASGAASRGELGQLVLTVSEGHLQHAPSNAYTSRPWTNATPSAASNEKLAKAVDMGVKAGRKLPGAALSNSYLADGVDVATFIFKYRSLAVLQAFDLAPRPPAAEVAEEAQVDDDLDAVIKQEERRLAELKKRRDKAKKLPVKQEVINVDDEPGPSRRRHRKIINVDAPPKKKPKMVVDLTGLDD